MQCYGCRSEVEPRWKSVGRCETCLFGMPPHRQREPSERELRSWKEDWCVSCEGPKDNDFAMVYDILWAKVPDEFTLGVMCLKCLEKYVRRRLKLSDFPESIPCNMMNWERIMRWCDEKC